VGQRPVLGGGRLAGLLRGQKREQVPRTLASAFTLCAHAHRRTADLALAAAQGRPAAAPTADPAVLSLETARDRLRTMALEWPQRVAAPALARPDMQWLGACPVPLAPAHPEADARDAIARLRDWLEQRILLEPSRHWLARHVEPEALAGWCAEHAPRLSPERHDRWKESSCETVVHAKNGTKDQCVQHSHPWIQPPRPRHSRG
jgi:hypothetical protein